MTGQGGGGSLILMDDWTTEGETWGFVILQLSHAHGRLNNGCGHLRFCDSTTLSSSWKTDTWGFVILQLSHAHGRPNNGCGHLRFCDSTTLSCSWMTEQRVWKPEVLWIYNSLMLMEDWTTGVETWGFVILQLSHAHGWPNNGCGNPRFCDSTTLSCSWMTEQRVWKPEVLWFYNSLMLMDDRTTGVETWGFVILQLSHPHERLNNGCGNLRFCDSTTLSCSWMIEQRVWKPEVLWFYNSLMLMDDRTTGVETWGFVIPQLSHAHGWPNNGCGNLRFCDSTTLSCSWKTAQRVWKLEVLWFYNSLMLMEDCTTGVETWGFVILQLSHPHGWLNNETSRSVIL